MRENAMFIFLIFFVVLFFGQNLYRKYEDDSEEEDSDDELGQEFQDTIRGKRMEISKKYFRSKFLRCTDVCISDSHGLLLDSAIVCRVLKKRVTPPIYFEVYPTDDDCRNGWLFPNLDYTKTADLMDRNSPRTLLCKTRQSYDIYSTLFPEKNVIYTGFTSLDKFLPVKKDYSKFIHVAGKSPWKGTTQVIQAWKNHPEWPTLLLVYRSHEIYLDFSVRNIRYLTDFLSEEKLNNLMNTCGIHVCTSEHEGFGHYLNEARSTGAVVLYSDAPCMNEFFVPYVSGIPVKTFYSGKMNDICPIYKVTPETVQVAVDYVLSLSEEKLENIGKHARQDYLSGAEQFKNKMETLLS